MNGIRSIRVEQTHDLYDSLQQLQNGGAPTESDELSYRCPVNTPVAEIRTFYNHAVSSIMGADLVNIEVSFMESDYVVVREVVEDRHEDGFHVTIEDLATLAEPDWQLDPDFELMLSFEYLTSDCVV